MIASLHPYEPPHNMPRSTESPDRVVGHAVLDRELMRSESDCRRVYSALELCPRPTLYPTIAPVGVERLIAVRSIMDRDVVVTGGATGRHYHFAAGQSREIPISDARLLVAEGDFGFSGGR